MVIGIAIIGIITSVAVPSYQDYVTRSKLKEGYHFLQNARLHVENYYIDKGKTKLRALNASNFEEEMDLKKNVRTRLIRDYWIGSGYGGDVTVWFRTQSNAPIPSALQGKWLFYLVGTINSGGMLKWECKSDYHGGAFTKYAPKECQ